MSSSSGPNCVSLRNSKPRGSFTRSAVCEDTAVSNRIEYEGVRSYLKPCWDEPDVEAPEQVAVELHYLGRASNILRRHAKDARRSVSEGLIELARYTWRVTRAADWPRQCWDVVEI